MGRGTTVNESSIGEVLRLAREQQGLTLQDVSDALNIKREYLEALEKDEYDAIPGAVFVKGFLRNYGNFLELDGIALAREYKENVEERTPQPEVRTIMPVKKKKVRKDSNKRRSSVRENGRKSLSLPASSFSCCSSFGF